MTKHINTIFRQAVFLIITSLLWGMSTTVLAAAAAPAKKWSAAAPWYFFPEANMVGNTGRGYYAFSDLPNGYDARPGWGIYDRCPVESLPDTISATGVVTRSKHIWYATSGESLYQYCSPASGAHWQGGYASLTCTEPYVLSGNDCLCPPSTFLGPVSQTCRPQCPSQYLAIGNICKPFPPCPDGLCIERDLGPPDVCSGNPINTATGNKFQTETDFTWGSGQIFKRFYNGGSAAEQGLGLAWRHSLMRRIVRVTDIETTYAPAPATDVDPDWLVYFGTYSRPNTVQTSHFLVERENGKNFAFLASGQPKFAGAGNGYLFAVTDNGFSVQDGVSTETYNAAGQLLSITAANGRRINLGYDANQKLIKAADNFGQTLSFDYGTANYLQKISVNGAFVASYDYNAGRLTKVTDAGNNSRQYLYEDSRNVFLLTGIVDENGQRFASWAYNQQGQTISSEHAGGVDKFTLIFGGDPLSGTRWTEETDPLGSTRRYNFKQIAKQWLLSDKNQPGGAGCSAASNNLLYDTNGNVTSRTDFNGNKTTYVYDLVRLLETSRTEAAGTPLARTISTEWHATWRLPLKVTEPGRVTSFAYDANANLLNKAITADGQTRRWSWTYADFGQVKTSTDPDGKTSSYQYDTQGNLTALTNAAQQITQFTRYDANGNPLEILSPDGIKSTLTYDSRNRLISRQVGAALSRFDYWPTGLLKQATLPDGLVINYLYDAAHRLSEITDNQGHREVYTLNKAGLQEQVDRYDPDSTLANGLLQVQQAQSVKPAK
jgi:YD repeat-containing protein